MSKIDDVKNYAAKWFDKGREHGKSPITKDMLAELETEGEQICQLFPEPRGVIGKRRKRPNLVFPPEYYEDESQPDQSRLLTPTEIGDALNLEKEGTYPCSDGSITHTISVDNLLRIQDIKTALTVATQKDAECQQRVKRIFRVIEGEFGWVAGLRRSDDKIMRQWQALKNIEEVT